MTDLLLVLFGMPPQIAMIIGLFYYAAILIGMCIIIGQLVKLNNKE